VTSIYVRFWVLQ